MSAGDAERQPLLASQEQSIQDPQSTGTSEAPMDADTSTPGPDAVEQTTYLWTILWYIVLISGGIIALIFVKGFIDAGEVDVSPL
jgi:hypothetical protein